MRGMKWLLLLPALVLLPPMPLDAADMQPTTLNAADTATLHAAETYLNSIRTLKARFTQTGPDGGVTTGTAWLDRPGRMRFQYDQPSPLLLVAGHGVVIFRDNQLDQTTTIPMDQTPLGLLLRDKITLSGDVTLTGFRHFGAELHITVVRTASPGDGSLTLFLNAAPLALLGWSVIDAEGRQTEIRLSDVVLGGAFAPNLFTFTDPDFGDSNGNTP